MQVVKGRRVVKVQYIEVDKLQKIGGEDNKPIDVYMNWTIHSIFTCLKIPSNNHKQLASRLLYGDQFEKAHCKEELPESECMVKRVELLEKISQIRRNLLSQNTQG